MEFGYSVACRTRSRTGKLATSGGVGNKKGAAFPTKSLPGRLGKSRNRGKFRPFARNQRDERKNEVIVLEDSSSSDPEEFGENKEIRGGGSGVRISGGRGDADTDVISVESISSDDDEEGQRLPDNVSGLEENVTSSESEADEDFSLGSDRRSVETEEEEEDSHCRSEEPATRPETLTGDEAIPNLQVEDVIKITSSEDDSDHESCVSRPVVIPGPVASRTRSKRRGGGRNPQRDAGPSPYHGTVKGHNMLSNSMGPQKKRKTAAVICESKKSGEQSDSCNSTQYKRRVGNRNHQSDNLPASYHAAVKNGVEKDQDMLSSSTGPQKKRKTAPYICRSKKSDENSDDASCSEVERRRGRRRSTDKSDFFRILADSIWNKNGKGIDEVQEQRQVMEVLPVNFPWLPEEEKPVEKTELEKEMEELWDMMNLAVQADQIGSSSVPDEEPDTVELDTSQLALCRRGKHWLFLDEEIGMRCKYCSYIEVEIRDYCPPVENLPSDVPYRSYHRDRGNARLDGLEVGSPECCSAECFSHICDGTVWDLIPGIRNQMYPHQQEAFEFMWKNLAGSVSLNELRSSSLQEKDTGGCIISHAPGTGKTRLTLVFLQAYLELFPDSRPVIIAPPGLLLTWEGEIKKWGVGVSFHNLNTPELSGKEDSKAVKMLDSHRLYQNNNSIRMVKLYSWSTTKSILLMSYDLFATLTGSTKEMEKMREILLKKPRVVILDEGHIPRNQGSQVWNQVIKLETKKRVILSGTPFQNNIKELLNTLHLVRQKIADSIPRSRKKFCQRTSVAHIDDSPAGAIEIKSIMAPYVHIHKGSILQESLPGLRECVVVLNPGELQLEVLKSFYGKAARMNRKDMSTFDFEHKQALISVHPSLALRINFSREDKSVIFREEEKLKAHELNPSKGVKTRFLKEFIQLCVSMGEKVLVFSQYIKPLDFIAQQLGKAFQWTNGREMLVMVGNLCTNQRQSMINLFNDPSSDARVLLASTKACSEGINLVGASRVILLDVVWNPAVERQAISRAYRLGQKKMVYTYHLIMKETYEWDKYQKQARKDRLSELVFSNGTCDGDNGRGKRPSTVSEDRILEEMTSHPKLRGLFHQIKYHPKRMDAVEHLGPTT